MTPEQKGRAKLLAEQETNAALTALDKAVASGVMSVGGATARACILGMQLRAKLDEISGTPERLWAASDRVVGPMDPALARQMLTVIELLRARNLRDGATATDAAHRTLCELIGQLRVHGDRTEAA